MRRALRLVSVQRGYDLRSFTLIAYGGAGPLHAGRSRGRPACARGRARARRRLLRARAASSRRCATTRSRRIGRRWSWEAKVVEDRFRALEEQCVAPLLAEGHGAERDRMRAERRPALRRPELRDRGAVAATPAALRPVRAPHRQLYGYATGESVECVNLRVWRSVPDAPATCRRSNPPPIRRHRRAARVLPGAGEADVPRYDRAALAPVAGRRPGPHRGRVVHDPRLPGPALRGRSPRQPRHARWRA